jgi:hypothetical protein
MLDLIKPSGRSIDRYAFKTETLLSLLDILKNLIEVSSNLK